MYFTREDLGFAEICVQLTAPASGLIANVSVDISSANGKQKTKVEWDSFGLPNYWANQYFTI